MIKKLINLFQNKNKTYDLGKLEKYGFISLPDMYACPNCKSKNISWKFYIPTDGSKPSITPKDICNNCGYKDDKGGFELTNIKLYRESKINQILDGYK